MGYKVINKTCSKFAKDTICVDVCELNDDSPNAVEIIVAPDFDVNMLAYDGIKLFNYNDPTSSIENILNNIKLKQAKCLLPSNERYNKMYEKGWVLLQ